jgi:cytidylate kinase
MKLKDRALNPNKRFIIAMDGPAASGKGFLSKALAEYYNLDYCSSSIFYRKLASLILKSNIQNHQSIIDISSDLARIKAYEPLDLYSIEISNFTSIISAIAEVRKNMYYLQRDVVTNSMRLIMEGRDIASVIAPDADLKIYVTASPEIRAKRRCKQLQEQGVSCRYEDILQDLIIRDTRDQSRLTSPLIRTNDALFVDSSNLDIDNTLYFIKNYIECN